MNSDDFVLSVIQSFGGVVAVGRASLLQKRAFFASELSGVNPGLRFDAHYYGPYSSTVDNTLGRLTALGFVNEDNLGFGVAPSGFEIKRYDYSLTEDGKKIARVLERQPEFQTVNSACQKIIDAGDPDYFILSIAAKAFFILKKRDGRAMLRNEIIQEAKRFDWDISSDSLEKAVSFLERVSLVRQEQGNN